MFANNRDSGGLADVRRGMATVWALLFGYVAARLGASEAFGAVCRLRRCFRWVSPAATDDAGRVSLRNLLVFQLDSRVAMRCSARAPPRCSRSARWPPVWRLGGSDGGSWR